MSTLDMVSDAGGNAGAFLDFGGSATSETIYQALTVISRVKTIQTIVVNLFGGINALIWLPKVFWGLFK